MVAERADRRRGRAPSRGRAGGGRAAPAGPAAGGCTRAGSAVAAPSSARSQQHVLQRDHPAARLRAARACVHSRRSVATWSLRLRPVCSLAPAGPASSVTRRSTAVWMSSSVGDELERRRSPARARRASSARERSRRASSSVMIPARAETAHVGPRTGDVVGPQPPVERQADRVRHQLLGRAAVEAAVPERVRRSPASSCRRISLRRGRLGPSCERRRGRQPQRVGERGRRCAPRRCTAACRRRRRCRAGRADPSGRGPTRPRGRSPAACASRRGWPTARPRPPTRPSPAAADRRARSLRLVLRDGVDASRRPAPAP